MPGEEPSFAADVRPLFRDRDRNAMVNLFDLWVHEDVSAHAEAILAAVANGSMPCDGRWPEADVETFRSWMAGGRKP